MTSQRVSVLSIALAILTNSVCNFFQTEQIMMVGWHVAEDKVTRSLQNGVLSVIEMLRQLKKNLTLFRRALKPTGRLVIIEPEAKPGRPRADYQRSMPSRRRVQKRTSATRDGSVFGFLGRPEKFQEA